MNRYLPLVLVLAVPTLGFAQSYEKNGLPCITELCIGDGLSELGKVKWDRARNSFSLPGTPDYVGSHPLIASQVESVKQVYRGDTTQAAPYLSYEAFDEKAIPLLANVTAACSKQELQGTFTSQNGNPTTVKIELLSDKKDVAIQRWTVISIWRTFPTAVSGAQKADVRKQLDGRYGRFSFTRGIRRGVAAIYAIRDDPLIQGSYGFILSLNTPVNEYEREREHPACGGKRKVSVD